MSGAEIVGLLASASQLAVYSVKIISSISEIYRRFQDAPKRIEQHVEHITQLADTAQLIEQHRSLQTININRQIRTTLKQAKTLSAILDQVTSDYAHGTVRNYWKILKGKKEKEILANLDQLEKEKSSLLLCISLVHTDLLGNIQGGVGKLVEELMTLMPERQDLQRELLVDRSNFARDQPQTDISEEPEQQPDTGLTLALEETGLNAKSMTLDQGKVSVTAAEENTDVNAREVRDDDFTLEQHHHFYDNISSISFARQVNGDTPSVRGHGPSPRHRYKDVTAKGSSRQVNGNVSDIRALKS